MNHIFRICRLTEVGRIDVADCSSIYESTNVEIDGRINRTHREGENQIGSPLFLFALEYLTDSNLEQYKSPAVESLVNGEVSMILKQLVRFFWIFILLVRSFPKVYERFTDHLLMKETKLQLDRIQETYYPKFKLAKTDEEKNDLLQSFAEETKNLREMFQVLESRDLLNLADRYSIARKPEWYVNPELKQDEIYKSERWGMNYGIRITEVAKISIRNEVRQKRLEFFVKVILPILGLIVALLAIFYKK